MALYEITMDCRIANKDFKKGDVVSNEEVGGYYPTIMKPTNGASKKVVKAPVEEKKEPSEEVAEEPKEEKKFKKNGKKD